MKRTIKPGIADYSTFVFIPDSASTDGSGKTGLVAANLTVSYARMETDNDATVTDVTSSLNNLAALTTAHTDWGLLEVSNTLAPGLYRLDIADAVFATGAWTAVVYVMVTTSAAAASPMEFIMPTTDMDAVYSDTTTIQSDTTSLASDLAEGDFSDILSRLTVTNSNVLIIKSDTSDVISALVKVYSDTTHIDTLATKIDSDQTSQLTVVTAIISDIQSDTNVMVPILSDIQSDTNKLVSDASEVDTSDIQSLLTKVYSDTNAITTLVTKIDSDIASTFTILEENTSDTESALVKIYSDTTAIEAGGGALTATQASQLARAQSDTIRILSDTTQVQSDTAHIESDAVRIESMSVVIKSDVITIQSDTITLASDLAEADFSDLSSLLTKIYSDTTLATAAAGEPAQGAPPASATAMSKIDYLYKAWRNKTTQDATTYSLFADDTTTVDHKATVSDDATTFTRGEVGTGP